MANPFHPEPPNLQKHGGTDIKRTALDPAASEEKPEDLASRWREAPLVEHDTKGSFLTITGTNQIQGKDPLAALNVSVADRKAPGWGEEAGHDPAKNAA